MPSGIDNDQVLFSSIYAKLVVKIDQEITRKGEKAKKILINYVIY